MKKRRTKAARPLLASGAACAVVIGGWPADAQVTWIPYVWTPAMSGDVSPLPAMPTVHTEQEFSDVVDALQFAFASGFEVRRGDWAVVGDFSYADTGQGAELKRPILGVEGAGVDTKSLIGTLALSRRIIDAEGGSLEVLGGTRINWADNDVRLMWADGSATKANDEETWLDPIVGARGIVRLSRRWSLSAYGDVGGFGLSSDLTWQAQATIDYRFTDGFALSVGYRHYAIDYDHNGFVFDVAEGGPLIAAAITF